MISFTAIKTICDKINTKIGFTSWTTLLWWIEYLEEEVVIVSLGVGVIQYYCSFEEEEEWVVRKGKKSEKVAFSKHHKRNGNAYLLHLTGAHSERECLNRMLCHSRATVKPVYLEHVDNWFLKLVLYNFNKYIIKNNLSTCST